MRDTAPETFQEKLEQLQELRYEAIHAGSQQAVEKQHERGKYTARERIEKLLDPGSFQELDTFVRHRTHEPGKYPARVRTDILPAPGSFREIDTFARHRTPEFEMKKTRPFGDAVAP